jgi:chromosome segregation ATPase
MVVMAPREKWTDERLDDLNKKVDDGFARVDGEIKDLRQEMNARFDQVDARFDKIDASFQALYRVLLGGAIVTIVGLIGLIAT